METFCEDFSKLKVRWDKTRNKLPRRHQLSDKVIIQVNMFSLFMAYRVLGEKNRIFIVT